ncbi:MAG: Xylose isomerase-like TIM barrel [Lentisphaerae bacterium ADurb.Bin242]|nr:MAG: Xylose isomerase-like TIM barrel [Lentisphaerae bacterium ADurb.Bin242]
MKKPVAVQLYSLREEAEADFRKTLERVAAIGFNGVETAGFHSLKPVELQKIVSDLGMKVCSMHGGLPQDPKAFDEWVGNAKLFGNDTLITGFWTDQYNSVEAIRKTADLCNATIEKLKPYGLRFALHNHWMEFMKVDGELAYSRLAKLCPELLFEIDTYWAANFGANDPAEMVALFKDRTPFLHIKDGSGGPHNEPQVAVGDGIMDFHKIIPAADPKVLRWLVVELDSCATDMFTAVEKSCRYLKQNGFAL